MSKIISYDFGHSEGGEDGSANGFLYEYRVVRDYGKVCIEALEKSGYTLVNCTPADGYMTLGQSLAYRVNKANASGSMLHLCFHANCFDNQVANGAEIEVAGDEGERIAEYVLKEIVSLGFNKRGINRPALYVTKHTNMPCLLTEPFFISNQRDCSLYNATTLGNAIAKGVISAIGGTYTAITVNIENNEDILEVSNLGLIQVGENSDRVKLIQGILVGFGADITADGAFGNCTKQAVIDFQESNGCGADGVVGAQTASVIYSKIKSTLGL